MISLSLKVATKIGNTRQISYISLIYSTYLPYLWYFLRTNFALLLSCKK
ncbi:hypothetical protein HMPREF2141_02384 [Bacteroides uniformis]|nr:hypothetical protein HMPREF2141_02384 [Bacteroides uniformis]